MTYVSIELTPDDVGFSHPISQELIENATRYIKEQLNSVSESHDDSETRHFDKRRTNAPISEGTWIVKFRRNKILITNQISDNASNQMRFLVNGNGSKDICARHVTRTFRKGWSSQDGHRSEIVGGKKPVPGSFGPPHPGMLKFYNKRNGSWMYRKCVKPIGADVIKDVNRDIRRAVFMGLEMSRYELYDNADRNTLGANEPEDAGMSDPVTMEEMHYQYHSKTKDEKDTLDYKQKKVEDQQLTMQSQVDEKLILERARSELQKVGVEPMPSQPVSPTPQPVKKSWFKKVLGAVTESISEKIHRYFEL